MKKDIIQKISIPEGVTVEIGEGKIIVEGPEGKNERIFKRNGLKIEKKENEIVIEFKKATKKEKKLINTLTAHLKNMIKGVKKKFEYKLKICFSHFPFSVEIKDNEALIKNFLGEKHNRKVKIPQGAEIDVEKEIIIVKSQNKELAGQVAANFEKITKVKNKDRRIFQDGIFMISKEGREI